MQIKAIYDDRLQFLNRIGGFEIKRASHVEPAEGGKWTADMSPSGGPVLGPFDTRAEALEEEKQWLLNKWHGELSTSGDQSQIGGSVRGT